MTDKPNNPQAFPEWKFQQGPNGSGHHTLTGGMTLRDYAVVHFSAAIVSNQSFLEALQSLPAIADEDARIGARVAEAAANMADEMLKGKQK